MKLQEASSWLVLNILMLNIQAARREVKKGRYLLKSVSVQVNLCGFGNIQCMSEMSQHDDEICFSSSIIGSQYN